MKLFRTCGVILTALSIVTALSCQKSSTGTSVAPTIGTVATLQGTVMRADTYKPLSGVIVSVGGVALTTGGDGNYAVSGLRPGPALLIAERQGFENFSEYVTLEGAKTVNIFLWPSDVGVAALTR